MLALITLGEMVLVRCLVNEIIEKHYKDVSHKN